MNRYGYKLRNRCFDFGKTFSLNVPRYKCLKHDVVKGFFSEEIYKQFLDEYHVSNTFY